MYCFHMNNVFLLNQKHVYFQIDCTTQTQNISWFYPIPIAYEYMVHTWDRDPSKVIKQFNSLSKILDRWKNAEYEYIRQYSKNIEK